MDECDHCTSEWRRRRKALGLTLERLAVKVDSTAGSLSYFERGVSGLNVETVLRLCDVLGIDAGELPAAWRSRPQGEPRSRPQGEQVAS